MHKAKGICSFLTLHNFYKNKLADWYLFIWSQQIFIYSKSLFCKFTICDIIFIVIFKRNVDAHGRGEHRFDLNYFDYSEVALITKERKIIITLLNFCYWLLTCYRFLLKYIFCFYYIWMTIIVRDETVYLLTQMRRLNQEKKYDMTNENNIKKTHIIYILPHGKKMLCSSINKLIF